MHHYLPWICLVKAVIFFTYVSIATIFFFYFTCQNEDEIIRGIRICLILLPPPALKSKRQVYLAVSVCPLFSTVLGTQAVLYLVVQSFAMLCDPIDCSPPGCSVHGILLARILEWAAMSSARGSSQPRDRTCASHIFCTGRRVLYR